MNKRMFKFLFLLPLFIISTLSGIKVEAAYYEYFDYGIEDIFNYHETDEYKQGKKSSYLIYQVNKDETSTVSVIGSYVIDKNGKIDETSCEETVVIPSEITYSGYKYSVTKTRETFVFKKNLKIVTFPDTIMQIGFNTLIGTSVEEIGVTKNIAVIDPDGIKYNPYLKKLWVSKSNKTYTSSGNIIYTKNMKSLVVAANLNNQTIKVKEGIETIKRNAFLNCVFEITKIQYWGNISSIILPKTIKLLEDGSIPYDVDMLQFLSTTMPTIKTDLVSYDSESNKPILLVNKSLVSKFKKLTYNGTKVKPAQVISTLKTTSAVQNAKISDKVLQYFDDANAKKIPSTITKKQYETIQAYYLPLIKNAKSDLEKINIIRNAISNRIYINDEFSGTLWDVHNKPKNGASRVYAVMYEVTVYKAVGLLPVKIFYHNENIKESDSQTYIVGIHSGNRLILVDLLSTLGYSYNIRYTPLDQETKYVDINRSIFDLNSYLYTVDYLTLYAI